MEAKTVFRNPSPQPLFSGRELLKMNMGFVLSYGLSLLVGMLDTVMIASVGDAAVSGVSLVDNLTQLVVFVFAAFGTGGAVVAGQYLGNREDGRACESTEQLLWLAALVSAVCTLVLFSGRGLILPLFFGNIAADVAREADLYLVITVFSFPAMAVYEAGNASLRAMGESDSMLKISLVMNTVNLGGNALMVYGLHMGTAGVAIPTLISRWTAALLVLHLLLREDRRIHIARRLRPVLRRADVFRILRVGIPSGIENGIFQLGKLMVVRLVAGFGTYAIAANAVAVVLTNINSLPGWGMNNGLMTVVSRCIGAHENRQARFYHRLLGFAALGLLMVWVGVNCLFMPVLMHLFGNLTGEATSLAREMVLIHAAGLVTVYVPAFITPAALRASGDVNFTMLVSVVSMWIFRVGGAYLLAGPLGMGTSGAWAAMVLDWVFRAFCFLMRWRSGVWENKRVI